MADAHLQPSSSEPFSFGLQCFHASKPMTPRRGGKITPTVNTKLVTSRNNKHKAQQCTTDDRKTDVYLNSKTNAIVSPSALASSSDLPAQSAAVQSALPLKRTNKKKKKPSDKQPLVGKVSHQQGANHLWRRLVLREAIPAFVWCHIRPKPNASHDAGFAPSFQMEQKEHTRLWEQTNCVRQMINVLDMRIRAWAKAMGRRPHVLCNIEDYNFQQTAPIRTSQSNSTSSVATGGDAIISPVLSAKVVVNSQVASLRLKMSESFSKLCEVGGFVRSLLMERGIPFYSISNSAVKKDFCGRGGAHKAHMMVELMQRNWISVDMLAELRLSGTAESHALPVRNLVKSNSNGDGFTVHDIPKPYQDMFDSVAIALFDRQFLVPHAATPTYSSVSSPSSSSHVRPSVTHGTPDMLVGFDLGVESPAMCIVDLSGDGNLYVTAFSPYLSQPLDVISVQAFCFTRRPQSSK